MIGGSRAAAAYCYVQAAAYCYVPPPWAVRSVGAHVRHIRLIGERVVDFLLVLIELFSLGVTAEALRVIICSKSAISLQRGPVDPKFQVDRVAPTNHSFSQKTRINYLSYHIKI